jgi:hypothetical protein
MILDVVTLAARSVEALIALILRLPAGLMILVAPSCMSSRDGAWMVVPTVRLDVTSAELLMEPVEIAGVLMPPENVNDAPLVVIVSDDR